MSFAFELLLHAIDEVESFLVENGQPNAEIIVAEKPPRRVRLASKELQAYIEKISGGRLTIATASDEVRLKIDVTRLRKEP